MKRCAGLDVSLETTSICIVDKAGQIIAERKVAACPDAIAQELRAKAPGLVRAGIETGPLAVWLWGELRRRELPILCLDARHANAALKMMPDKTDRADARGLARIVRTGRFRQACVQSLESHAVRALLAARKQPVGMRCRLGNGIRGTLRTTFGIRFGKRTGGFTRRAEAILAEDLAALPAIRFTVGGFSACIDALSLSIVTALAGAGRWVCGARGAAARSRSRTASCAASSATAARAAG